MENLTSMQFSNAEKIPISFWRFVRKTDISDMGYIPYSFTTLKVSPKNTSTFVAIPYTMEKEGKSKVREYIVCNLNSTIFLWS